MNEKLMKYSEQFGENFPMFIVRNMEENEIIKIIDDCLKTNTPYELNIEDGDDY